jgi:hypothetical protein
MENIIVILIASASLLLQAFEYFGFKKLNSFMNKKNQLLA